MAAIVHQQWRRAFVHTATGAMNIIRRPMPGGSARVLNSSLTIEPGLLVTEAESKGGCGYGYGPHAKKTERQAQVAK
jgi:hypothetical protein